MSSSLVDQSFDSQASPSARAELQNENDRLKLFLDVTNTLVANLEFRALLRAISASIRQVMQCDIVGVWLPDSEHFQLRQIGMDCPESKGFLNNARNAPVAGTYEAIEREEIARILKITNGRIAGLGEMRRAWIAIERRCSRA